MMKIKRIIVIGLVGAIAIITVPISRAVALENNILKDIRVQFNNIKSDWLAVANGFQGRMQAWLESQLDINIDDKIGELGLPDPQEIRSEIEEAFRTEGKIEEGDEAANWEDRTSTRIKAQGTLSTSGQQKVIDKFYSVENTTQQAILHGNNAQGRTVTQQVLKDMALQNAQIASSLGLLTSEIVDSSTKQDLTNLNLTNISEAIDSQNLRQQADVTGAANSLLQIGGFASAGLDYSGEP